MRPGMRSRAPARADRATLHTTQCQVFGQPVWAIDPWLEFGADPKTQNAIGGLHCAGVGNQVEFRQVIPWESGVVEFTGSVSGSVLTLISMGSVGPGLSVGQLLTWYTGTSTGDYEYITGLASGSWNANGSTYNLSSSNSLTSRTMWARHPFANRDGGQAFGVVADPVNSGRLCHVSRVIRDDPNAGGQTGRKTMPRTELSGSTGAGELQYADMLLNAWSVMVPTATREMYTGTYYTEDEFDVCNRVGWGMGGTLIYQNKTGQPIQHAIWLCPPGNTSTNQAGPYFELQPSEIPSGRFTKFLIDFPADTWIHFIQLQKHGVRPWSSGLRMNDGRASSGDYWSQISHNGYCYVARTGAGTGVAGTASNTAPTHTTTGAEVVHDGITWRCLGTIDAAQTDPKCWIWAAIGNGAYSLVIDASPETNLPWPDTSQCNPNEINTQIGWYTNRVDTTFDVYGAGDSGPIVEASIVSYPNTSWTASSDGVNVVERLEKSLYWKGPYSARPVIANQYRNTLPTDRLLTQWFDVLRSR
jgi:hypothetical protein